MTSTAHSTGIFFIHFFIKSNSIKQRTTHTPLGMRGPKDGSRRLNPKILEVTLLIVEYRNRVIRDTLAAALLPIVEVKALSRTRGSRDCGAEQLHDQTWLSRQQKSKKPYDHLWTQLLPSKLHRELIRPRMHREHCNLT